MATMMSNYIATSGLRDPEPEIKKELLIFAIYVEVGSISEQKVRSKLHELHEMYNRTFAEIENQTNYLIKTFIFPIKVGNTRMECIFSGDNTKTGKSNIQDILSTLEKPEENAEGFSVGAESRTWQEAVSEATKHYDHNLSELGSMGISEPFLVVRNHMSLYE
jgi:hypothetical protein